MDEDVRIRLAESINNLGLSWTASSYTDEDRVDLNLA